MATASSTTNSASGQARAALAAPGHAPCSRRRPRTAAAPPMTSPCRTTGLVLADRVDQREHDEPQPDQRGARCERRPASGGRTCCRSETDGNGDRPEPRPAGHHPHWSRGSRRPRPAAGAGTAASGRSRSRSRSPASGCPAPTKPGTPRERVERVLHPVGQRPDREQLGDVEQRLGHPGGREPDARDERQRQDRRFTTTGAASAFGMKRVIPIPSVVNAAVPSTSVTISPGSVEARMWTP